MTSTMETLKKFKIPAVNLGKFQRKMENLNEKCLKLKVPEVGFKILEHIPEKVNLKGEMVQVESYLVEVTGVAPKFEGWEFIATLEHTEHGNVIRSIKEVPAIYQSIESHCDHCKVKRQRNDTFLLHHETLGYAQVGRSCIRDFLGHKSPEQIAAYESYLKEISDVENLEEDMGSSGGEIWLSYYVEWCTHIILKRGYRSKKSDNPTAYQVCFIDKKENTLDQRDIRIAREAIAWNQARGGDQFNNSISIIFKKEIISPRDFGFISFGVFEYIKHLGELPQFEKKNPSNWIGEVEKRIEFKKITVTKKMEFESADTRFSRWFYIYVMSDENNNVITWKTSNASLEALKTYDFKATIKDHSEYKGTKQTEVTRLKVLKMYQEETENEISGQTSTEDLF